MRRQRWNSLSHNKQIQNTISKAVQDKAWLSRKGDLLGIVQEVKIWPFYQIVYAQTRIRLIEWDA